MALRDQPYFPFYVQDFITDEKLTNCSAESTGVYIRLMCAMHKSEEYGKILLRQKDRQTDRQTYNFAVMLARQMPYNVDVIERALNELLEERVIYMDGDVIYQKRMVKDAELSEKRAKSGKKGAERTNKRFNKNKKFAVDFDAAKTAANSENEYEYENENEIDSKTDIVQSTDKREKLKEHTHTRVDDDDEEDDLFDDFWNAYPKKTGDIKSAYFEYLGVIKTTAPEILIGAVKQQSKDMTREDCRYFPSAEKWLRNKGWMAKSDFREPEKKKPQQEDGYIAPFTPKEKRHEPYDLSDMVEWPPGSNHYIPSREVPKDGG